MNYKINASFGAESEGKIIATIISAFTKSTDWVASTFGIYTTSN